MLQWQITLKSPWVISSSWCTSIEGWEGFGPQTIRDSSWHWLHYLITLPSQHMASRAPQCGGSSQVLPTAQWPQLVTGPNLTARGDEGEESQRWWFLYSLSHYVLWICVHCVSITISLETWSTKFLLKKQEKKGVSGLVYRVEFDKRILMSYRSFHIF